jgi:thiamine-phosphate pyrophosphorylase
MMKNFGLYPVITEEFCAGRSSLFVLKEVLRAGVKIVQLREKDKSEKELLYLAKEYRALTGYYGALLIINDNIDLALEVGADGVHLGQEDLSCIDARKSAPSLLIGVSTHNTEEIKKAITDGADYINIGPVFHTSTKKNLAYQPVGIEFLREAVSLVNIPFSVMGGIKKDHIKSLLDIGVKNIAMITEITEAKDIYAATKEMVDMIDLYL